MNVRGNIAIAIDNVYAKVIFCGSDAYQKDLGAMLKCYYFNEELVEELINNGDVFSVGKFVGEKHNFNKRLKNWCNFYGRDRDESNCEACTRRINSDWNRAGVERDYLYRDNRWYVRHSCDIVDTDWRILTDEECGITEQDKEKAKKEVMKYLKAKKN